MRRSLAGLACTAAVLAVLPLGAAPASAARPAKCSSPPVTMRVEAAGTAPVGSSSFRVTDGVARRVAILPKAKADFTDTKARARLERRAATTSLAAYSIYLADFAIPRRELRGFSFGDIRPTRTGTVATLTIVPPSKKGFAEGDVVTDRRAGYDTTTTFAPLGLTVRSAANATDSLAYTDVIGEVTIVEVDAKRICLDIDLELRNGDDLVSAARGTVAVPVVRAANSFFFT